MWLQLLQVIGTSINLLFTIYQVPAFCNNYKAISGTGKLEDAVKSKTGKRKSHLEKNNEVLFKLV